MRLTWTSQTQFALLICLTIFSGQAEAQFPSMSDPFRGFDLTRVALGTSCTGVLNANSSLPCQPALLATQPEKKFSGNLMIGNEYSKIYNYSKLVNEGRQPEVVEEVLSQKRPLQLNGSAQLWFRSSNVAVSFVPGAISYFSYVRNSAYPSIQLQAMLERNLTAQIGSYIGDDFYFGLQARGVDRTFVQDQFDFYEYLARPGSYLQSQRQRALYLEPALAYVHTSEWKPRATAMLSNVGWTDHKHQAVSLSPVLTTALGVSPPIESFDLDLSVAYRLSDRFDGRERGLSFGTLLQVGVLSTTFGASKDALSVGVQSAYESFRVGLLYQRESFQGLAEKGDAIHADIGIQLQ